MVKGTGYRPTVAVIDLDALRHNLHIMRNHIPEQIEIMAIVKANAYGHGAVSIAKEAVQSGATRLGVAFLDEAIELRQAGIEAPILVLGYTSPEGYPIAQELKIACTIFDENQIDEAIWSLSNEFPPLSVHLKVETGMNRIGFIDRQEFIRVNQKIAHTKVLHLEGVFTHMARADEEDSSYTQLQMERFEQWLEELQKLEINPEIIHVNNSAGAILYPKQSRSCIRFGIAMYGLFPSAYVRQEKPLDLQPVLTLRSRITQLKEVSAGSPISYGGTYCTTEQSKIATIPIGYGDGYPRSLSNCGIVLVRGERARVVGRVCMDQLMIDVSHISDVCVGDEVILIGRQGNDQITADEVADWLGTINYEVVTRLSHRIRREIKG